MHHDQGVDTMMISETLRRLHHDGLLTPRTFVAATGRDASTLYRYLPGNCAPSYTTIQQLMAHCGDERIQAALVADFLRGSRWIATVLPEGMDYEDARGGGCDCDVESILTAACAANLEMAELLEEIARSIDDRKVTAAELGELDRLGMDVIGKVFAALTLARALSARQGRRRKCAPSGGGNGNGGGA